MKTRLKVHHIVLPVLTVPVCMFIFISYGWTAFSTISNRSGVTGDMYLYYNLTALEFSAYNIILAFTGLLIASLIAFYLIKLAPKKLDKMFWSFFVFMVIVAVCEFILQTRFQSKG